MKVAVCKITLGENQSFTAPGRSAREARVKAKKEVRERGYTIQDTSVKWVTPLTRRKRG